MARWESLVLFERIADASDPDDAYAAELRREAAYSRLPIIDEDGVVAILDARLVRQALPHGSCPVYFNGRHESGQYFTETEIGAFARRFGWTEERDTIDRAAAQPHEPS